MLHAANQDRNDEATVEHQVRAMFHRVVVPWASEALSLRQRGLDRPSSRDGGRWAVAPPAGSGGWSDPVYCQSPPIRWMPRRQPASQRFGEF